MFIGWADSLVLIGSNYFDNELGYNVNMDDTFCFWAEYHVCTLDGLLFLGFGFDYKAQTT
jgi:hypothetical protein